MRRFPRQKYKTRAASGGFTLIETLVAISILAVAIAAPISIAEQGLISANFAKDQVVANYLASEAVEFVRNIRDDNSLLKSQNPNLAWLSGLEACRSAGGCSVEPAGDVRSCAENRDCKLLFNSRTGLYKPASVAVGPDWKETSFTRRVVITETVPNVEADVLVTVSWTNHTIPVSFSVGEHMMNWRQ